MTRKRDAAIGNDVFREWRGDQGAELAIHAALGCPAQTCEQCIRIYRIRPARLDRYRERCVNNMQTAIELSLVTDYNDVVPEARTHKRVAQLGPDAGGFACRNYQWFIECHT